MDGRSMEEMIRRRERNYIWLERELKRNLIISTAAIAVLFLFALFLKPPVSYWMAALLFVLALNSLWCYLTYRREYKNYLSIAAYLEEFEKGNYDRHPESDYLEVGIHAQLTEQIERMGDAFGTLKHRLEEEKENTKRLVTDISHQLKTPIAALELSYELLDDEKLTPAEKQEFLRRSKKEVHKLSSLLGALTNLSRMEADMIQIKPESCSLKETLIRAVNGVYFKAVEKKIEIEMSPFRDIELVHDSKWTVEAVSNVLDNAVKYSSEGSRIEIRVEPQISYVFIEVEDKGIGIPRSEYQNIFKRFYRGSLPEVAGQEGAGVGLYLVRQIFEAQGGSVRALPAPQGGTVMQMMLPHIYSRQYERASSEPC